MQAQLQIAEGGATPYAAAADFGEVFTEEMHSLYLLSFLLTADMDKLYNVLSAPWENVSREWARSWKGTFMGAPRDYQASHSEDQASARGHGSRAA